MRINLVNSYPTALLIPGVYDLLQKYFDVHRVDDLEQPGITIINQRDKDKIIDRQNIIFENLWEIPQGNEKTLEDVRWFWINEALWYTHLNLDSYVSHKTWQYSWLMPMNLRKPWRTIFRDMVKDRLDDCVWSYCAEGKLLPGSKGATTIQDQREFNPAWWDSTAAVIAIESSVAINQTIFPTEKSLRSFAFSSPMLVVGQKGLLLELKDWGFETWPELWNESYDSIQETIPRLTAVAQIVKETKIKSYPKSVVDKLKHNRNLFWNRKKIISMFEQIVVEPITRMNHVGKI